MSDAMRDRLRAKLNPDALKVSGKMTALLAYFLDTEWTTPTIKGLTITSDGILLEGQMANDVIGNADDLYRNLNGIAEAVGLTKAETRALLAAADAHVTDWRRPAYAYRFTEVEA